MPWYLPLEDLPRDFRFADPLTNPLVTNGYADGSRSGGQWFKSQVEMRISGKFREFTYLRCDKYTSMMWPTLGLRMAKGLRIRTDRMQSMKAALLLLMFCGLLVTTLNPAKADEMIEMLFGMSGLKPAKRPILDGVHVGATW